MHNRFSLQNVACEQRKKNGLKYEFRLVCSLRSENTISSIGNKIYIHVINQTARTVDGVS